MKTYLTALRVTDIYRTRGEAGGTPNATRQALHGATALRRGKRLVDRDARIGPSQVTLQLTPVETNQAKNLPAPSGAARRGGARASAERVLQGMGGD